ncbi:MAG: hypothetical protein E7427_09750 [Ruminococcaceae bacterium]|nr:hypothetical protein [Oscillospiraceae bacterium]
MTEEAKRRLAEKNARNEAALALREGDRVPIHVLGNIYAVVHAGYTMAEVIYDETLEKQKNSIIRYLLDYDPDCSTGPDHLAGLGRAFEKLGPKFIDWAGRPGTKLDENSLMQFVEFPILEEEEFDWFFSDRTGWALRKSMPSLSRLAEPLRRLEIPQSHGGQLRPLISAFSSPEMREMLRTFWEIDDLFRENARRRGEMMKEIAQLGFPQTGGGRASVPFDDYSDELRGTLLSLTDLYEHADEVEHYIDERQELMLEQIRHMNPDGSKSGKLVHMMLHKGLDGFMGDETYVKFYWRHLQEIIQAIVDVGMVPSVFCEGRYSTRLEHLRDVPRGKVLYRFEDTPMDLAKKVLGDVACITGGFDNTLLTFGTVQQVTDACKKMLDDCAAGGGFIFQAKSSLVGDCKPENVEAMFRTVRDYGKY